MNGKPFRRKGVRIDAGMRLPARSGFPGGEKEQDMNTNEGNEDKDMTRELQMLASELKEAVDVLELASACNGSHAQRDHGEKALRSVEEILREINSAARAKTMGGRPGDRGWMRGKQAEGSGSTYGAWERAETTLSLLWAQCERAEKAINAVGWGEEAEPFRRRAAELHRFLEAMALARDLREARTALGLTQSAAAERMDISPAYLSRLEHAACNPPSARTRRRVDAFLALAAERAGDFAVHEAGERPGFGLPDGNALDAERSGKAADAVGEGDRALRGSGTRRVKAEAGSKGKEKDDAGREDGEKLARMPAHAVSGDSLSGVTAGPSREACDERDRPRLLRHFIFLLPSLLRREACDERDRPRLLRHFIFLLPSLLRREACDERDRPRLLRTLLDLSLRLEEADLEVLVELARQLLGAKGRS